MILLLISLISVAHAGLLSGSSFQSTCAVTNRTGSVECWGAGHSIVVDGAYYNTMGGSTATTAPGLGGNVTSVSVGARNACAVKDGGAFCWGLGGSDNTYSNGAPGGLLGTGNTDSQRVATPVVGLASGVVSVTTGHDHSCAVLENGTAACWGVNQQNQLGQEACCGMDGSRHYCGHCGDNQQGSSVPWFVQGLNASVVSISAGMRLTCAVLADTSVVCWGGYGYLSKLGHPNIWEQKLGEEKKGRATGNFGAGDPVVGLESGVLSISTGFTYACATKTDGSVWCWGVNNLLGELGHREPDETPACDSTTPLPVVAVHSSDACTSFTPQPVPGVTNAVAVAVSQNTAANGLASQGKQDGPHTCVITAEGTVLCWGSGGWGKLGNGDTDNRAAPTLVVGLPAGKAPHSVVASESSTCVMVEGGEVWCWGRLRSLGIGSQSQEFATAPALVHGSDVWGPTMQPTTAQPTTAPSGSPSSVAPSAVPSTTPSMAPSGSPSLAPSSAPSEAPSEAPSTAPSSGPSSAPSLPPSDETVVSEGIRSSTRVSEVAVALVVAAAAWDSYAASY